MTERRGKQRHYSTDGKVGRELAAGGVFQPDFALPPGITIIESKTGLSRSMTREHIEPGVAERRINLLGGLAH
jgi:hypothetical protein